jgi:hypothetical protein
MPVVGSVMGKAPTVTPQAGAGGFTMQHPSLGGNPLDPEALAQQQEQMQAQNDLQVGEIQGKLDMTTEAHKNSQAELKKNTQQWLGSLTDRVAKVASDWEFKGELSDNPTGRAPTPGVTVPGALPSGGWYDVVKKMGLGNLFNRYAPNPMGPVTDYNTRFGQNYAEAAGTIGRISAKQPPGIALLANVAGGLASKYLGGGGPDMSNIGTDMSGAADQISSVLGNKFP